MDEIAERGWSVIPDFIPAEVVTEMREELRNLWQEGEFRRAGVGRGASLQVRPEIRTDYVHWLEPNALTPLQQAYWDQIDTLRQTLNQEFFLSLRSFEAHFAVYPAGSFYKKHLDQFSQTRHRIISCILYLNPNWTPADGGQLRIYEADGLGHTDVTPYGGTLVCFRSADVFHEVLPAHRERFSLTGWLRTE